MKQTLIVIFFTLFFTTFVTHAADQKAFSGAGIIESSTGGFMFPDGSLQTTAVSEACTAITFLPYVISSAGVYCFSGNLERSDTTGDAITINADNVVIELNGWMLDGLSAGTATLARGIYGNQRKNVIIRNGTIRGFSKAIELEDITPTHSVSNGNIIESILAVQNTINGFWIDGKGNILRNNLVHETGPSTSPDPNNYGIRIRGPAVRVLNNDIIDSTGDYIGGHGLHISESDGVVIEGNRIDDVDASSGATYGIYISDSTNVLVANNRITNVTNGIVYNSSTGKYRDNLTSNVITEFTGGTDAGGND